LFKTSFYSFYLTILAETRSKWSKILPGLSVSVPGLVFAVLALSLAAELHLGIDYHLDVAQLIISDTISKLCQYISIISIVMILNFINIAYWLIDIIEYCCIFSLCIKAWSPQG
jgi:hypothetical protein